MDFANLLDAQTQAVQRVITRKQLETQLASETNSTTIQTLKNQIRQVQWELTQANNYIIENGLLPQGYSSEVFNGFGNVITPWSNEYEIPGTQKYDIANSTPVDQATLEERNSFNISQLNTMLYESQSLLIQNQNDLSEAYQLPITDSGRALKISVAQNNITNLLSQIKIYTTDIAYLSNQDYTVPSQAVMIPRDQFSAGIRASIQQILNNKVGYVSDADDLDATIGMRRRALDAYYTATNQTEKDVALKRLQTIAAALSPNVPITRNTVEIDDLYLDNIINQIGVLNIEIQPKQVTWDAAFEALKIAEETGTPEEIAIAQAAYDSAESDYNITLNKIYKQYEALLGYHNSFGPAASYPGSDEVTKYVSKPNPDYYGENAYPLVWDTKDEKFVAPDVAKGDPGRYISTTYTTESPNDKQTDQQRMQSILSQKYVDTASKAAQYQYEKATQQAIFENNNRKDIIAGQQKDLAQLQSEFNAAKADSKNPMSDEDFLKYQTKINDIQSEINTNQKVINDNDKLISNAQIERQKNQNPTVVWEAEQTNAAGLAMKNAQVAAEVPNAIQQGQQVAASLYDAKAETRIAEKQYGAAESIANAARDKAIAEAKARGVTDPTNPENWDGALKDDYNAKEELRQDAKDGLTNAQQIESEAAKAADDLIKNVPDKDKESVLSQYGLTQYDINKSLLATNPNPSEDIKAAILNDTKTQYKAQREVELQSAKTVKLAAEEEFKNIDKNLSEKYGPGYDDSNLTPQELAQRNLARDNLASAEANFVNAQDRFNNSDNDAIAYVDQLIKDAQTDDDAYKFSNTGFEGLNNGAPFYMQFPTLNSITDFKLKNGIDPYGNKSEEEIARDAIVFKIFETVPGVERSEEVTLDNGGKYIRNVPSTTNINTLGSFTIYPSHEDGLGNWLTQTHNHQYSSDAGGILPLLNNGLDIIGNLESFLQLGNAGLNAINSGSLKGNQPAGNAYNRRVDRLDYYQSSDSQVIPIKFNLFTKNNFLNDVYRPIMFLTALGYPKRAMKGDLGNLAGDVLKKSINNLGQFKDNSFANFVKNALELLPDPTNVADTLNDLEKKAAEFGGIGPFRYFISKRPEYLTIRHASGLFYFPVAVITSFSYTFKGPWYNYDGQEIPYSSDLDALISTQIKNTSPNKDQTFKEKVNQVFTETAQNIRDTFRPPPEPVPTPNSSSRPSGTPGGLLNMSEMDLQFIREKGLPYAYPSWAECTITVKNAVPMFRDDFMQLYYASQSGGENLVSVTKQMTNQQVFASGGRKTKDAMVDDEFRRKNI